MTRIRWRMFPIVFLALPIQGCELEEVTVVEIEDVVVAEVYAQVQLPVPDQVVPPNRLSAFLHRTVDRLGGERPVSGARVVVTPEVGAPIVLVERPVEACVEADTMEVVGSCYTATPEEAATLGPGTALSVRIDLADGGVLEGSTRVPGAFEVGAIGAGCFLLPDRQLRISWTRSEGAWAYINETVIQGLEAALAPEGIEADDPLYLLGLSVSAEDTQISFPSEFGVFDRFDLDRDLAVRLQTGLPADVTSSITITAADRNYVNWVRGGNFNPSGQVRVPSIRGDGSGAFAAVLVRRFAVRVDDTPVGVSARCPG